MDQSETACDFTPRRLARQLDFTAVRGAMAHPKLPQSPSQSILQPPSQPQPQQLQFHLQSVRQPPWLYTQGQQQTASQSQVMPQLQAARPQLVSPVRPIPHPAQKLPVKVLQVSKQESPKSRPRYDVELKDSTPKKQKQCNCKNSRCLKLYCECFAAGIYCDGCNCVNCHNNVDNEAADNGNSGAETDIGMEKGIQRNCVGNCPIPATIERSQTNYAITNGHGNTDLSLRIASISVPPGISAIHVRN